MDTAINKMRQFVIQYTLDGYKFRVEIAPLEDKPDFKM